METNETEHHPTLIEFEPSLLICTLCLWCFHFFTRCNLVCQGVMGGEIQVLVHVGLLSVNRCGVCHTFRESVTWEIVQQGCRTDT